MKRSLALGLLLATAGVATTAAVAQTNLLSGVDQTGVDQSVRPGDDFNAYANGRWAATAEIPADRSSTGVGYQVFQVAERRTADIIQGAGASRPAAGTDARRIADYYAAYTNVAAIEQLGLTPLRPQLDAIAGLTNKSQLARYIGSTVRNDTDPLNNTNFATEHLFGVFVTQDLDRPTVTIPYLMQGGLGLPDRDYYLSDTAEMRETRTAYRAYVANVLRMAGMSDPDTRAGRILDLETRIARTHMTIVESNDAHNVRHWSRDQFASNAPGLDWAAFWTAAGLPRQTTFGVWQPTAITGLAALVASQPMEAWQDFLAFHTINENANVLPHAYDQAHFDFYGHTLNGTPQNLARDRRGIAAVNAGLGDAVGHIYAQRYFPASSRTEIQGMVRNIVAAFDHRLAGLDWLAPATRTEARRKLQVLYVGVGYPDHWRNYSSLVVRPGDALGNQQRAELWEYQHQLSKIGRPVDRQEWWMTPQTVNAVNLPVQNALNFPAAILNTPYFDARFDAAANYGSIGAVIGHEISHSFDNLGSDFDSTGRLHNWWTDADRAHFDQQSQALVAQYNAYTALPGLQLNGRQELGENIADVAGLLAAYEAYHTSLGGRPAPVIDGMTGDQRFFMAFAQAWRSKMRDQALRARIATDVHAPAMWRVQTVRNLDAWYQAYNVQPGQRLYLAPAQRVRIW